MSSTIITLVLWVPFAIVVVIAGLIFCIRGYKQGVIRSLFSLGATLVSAICSMLLSRLCSSGIAKGLVGSLVESNMSNIGEADAIIGMETIKAIITAVLGVVVSIVLFSLFMFILTIIIKVVVKRIKKDSFKPETKGQKWGGLAVRLADTLIFALLLFMPIYSTLGTYAPAAQAVMPYVSEDEEVEEYLSAVTGHPLVQVSAKGPVRWLYSGLSSTKVSGYSLNFPQMMESLEKVVARFEGLGNVSKEELPQEAQELIQVVREEIVHTDWFYFFANTALTSVADASKTQISELEPEEAEQVQELLELLYMSEEDMKDNLDAILDFGEYLLANDFISIMDSDIAQFDALYEIDFFGKLGELANHSTQTVALKNMIYVTAAKNLQENNPEIANLVLLMCGTDASASTDYTAEGESLMLLMAGDGIYYILEGAARHPQVGIDKALVVLENTAMSELLGFEQGTQEAIYVDSNPKVKEAVKEQFLKCAQGQVQDTTFAQYVDTLGLVASRQYYEYLNLFDNGPSTVVFAANALGQEFWEGTSTSEYSLMTQFVPYVSNEASKDWYINEGFLYLTQLADLAKQGLFESGEAGSGSEFEQMVVNYLYTFARSESLYQAMDVMVDEKGTDPLGYGKNLSTAQKQWFKNLTDMVVEGTVEGDMGLGSMGTIIVGGSSGGASVEGGFVSGEISGTTSIVTGEDGSMMIVDENGNVLGSMGQDGSFNIGDSSIIIGGSASTGGTPKEEVMTSLLKFLGIS